MKISEKAEITPKLVLEFSESIFDDLKQIRQNLHKIPEPGFKEEKTSACICRQLTDLSIPFKRIAGTGVIADIISDRTYPTIALRADIDALPIEEKADVPFKSEHRGFMHACGHDIHTACLLGTLQILNRLSDRLPVNVRAVFQPAEESFPGGARTVINDGALEAPEVSAIFGLHVDPYFPTGQIALKSGAMMASTSKFTITVKGSGGHAAAPFKTVDPIPVASQIVLALQNIVSRMINPLAPCVISVTSINAGNTYNIIPEEAVITGTARTLDRETESIIPQKMKNLVDGITKSFGAEYKFLYEPGTTVLVNNEHMTEHVSTTAMDILGRENVIEYKGTLGGEDFADYLEYVPGCFFRLGCNLPNSEPVPAHNPFFNPDDRSLIYGMAVLAGTVLFYNKD